MPSVRIEELIEKLNLKNLTPEVDIKIKKITQPDINRPALQLAGYFEHYEETRPQIIGFVEYSYMEHMEEEKKKEEPKEKSEVKPVQSSGPTLEQELKKVFGMKSETTIGGSRIENLGKYFLDKYTGQVTLVTYQRGEPVRWNILRDKTDDDIVYDEEAYNYQLIRYDNGNDQILLMNINTGAMWAIDTKGFSYKNTRLKYIPAVETTW